MKNFILLIIATLFVLASEAQVNVTFKVNMAEVAVSANGVHVAGAFNNWTPDSTMMTDSNNDSIYEVTVAVTAGSFEYKFINGTTWNDDESVPAGCATNNNRMVTINGDSIIDAVCFESCVDCDVVIPTYDVTFSVDMSNDTVSADGVHIAGVFNNWTPDSTQLTDADSNGVYEVTVNIEEGIHTYKFINGNGWGKDESVPSACATDNNRSVTVSGNDQLDVVCFSSCSECDAPKYDVTFKVNLSGEPVISSNGVHLTGDFNTWSTISTEMLDADSNKIYEVTLQLEAGSYGYKFINGDDWGDDETVDSTCAVNNNRVVSVDANTDLGVICFNYCDSICMFTSIDKKRGVNIEIGPNPFTEYTVVRMNGSSAYNYSIYDISGSVVVNKNSSEQDLIIRREGMKNGFYMLVIKFETGQQITKKLIVN